MGPGRLMQVLSNRSNVSYVKPGSRKGSKKQQILCSWGVEEKKDGKRAAGELKELIWLQLSNLVFGQAASASGREAMGGSPWLRGKASSDGPVEEAIGCQRLKHAK